MIHGVAHWDTKMDLVIASVGDFEPLIDQLFTVDGAEIHLRDRSPAVRTNAVDVLGCIASNQAISTERNADYPGRARFGSAIS